MTGGIAIRYARRLLEMEPEEVAARIRQHAGTPAPGLRRWAPPPRSVAAEWLDRHFLFGPAGAAAKVEAWARNRPDQAARLVEVARRGVEGGWDVFGTRVRLEPGRIDWQRGDLRWAWELNRHAFFFSLARAGVLTGDHRFAERVSGLVLDWRRRNPFGTGVNWSSALEVAVRALSWLWTLPLIWPSEPAWEEWWNGLCEHYEYLRTHLSVYTDQTNHLIGETAALWVLSVAVPGLPGASREERRALEILAAEVARQVTPDGVNREQSTGYQRFVLDFCRQVTALARKTGRRLPSVLEQRTGAMAAFLAWLGGEHAPAIGDGDGGRGAPLEEPGADLNWWLDAEPDDPATGRAQPTGYCYWEADGLASLFDVGPLGLWPNASHGHADALSIQVRVGSRWLLGDPGTGAYAANPAVRDALRGTAAHNTVTVDAHDQADPWEVFKWLQPAEAQLLDSYSDQRYDYALAMHHGYRRLAPPVTHFRSVLFVRPPASDAGWIIKDRLEGAGRRRCALWFHFPPGVELWNEGPRAVRAVDPDTGAGLRLAFSDTRWRKVEGLWSRRFGQWEKAPVVTLERTVELPLVWLTLLTPIR